MANRYLVGSGAFTSTSIWSSTYNGSGGASVPVSGDVIHVDASHSITSGLPNSSSFDFIVYLGANGSGPVTLGFSGSPTFRSLIIQSKNSAAHTVNFDSGAAITVDKFVAIGSSTASRLTLGSGAAAFLSVNENGSVYGQNLFIDGLSASGSPTAPHYIGSNSVDDYSVGSQPWLTQDPPKISTLVDPLTTAPGSNPNWTVSGTVTQVTSGVGGGGYSFNTIGGSAVSTDTFDFYNSDFYVELPDTITSGTLYIVVKAGIHTLQVRATSTFNYSEYLRSGSTWGSSGGSKKITGFRIDSAGDVKFLSYNGSSISAGGTVATIPSADIPLFRSARVEVYHDNSTGAGLTLGSINMIPNSPPTTALNSPANATNLTTTTPTLAFTATDPEGDQVSYQVQVSTSSSFTTTHMDVTTTTYASGTQQTRVVSPALTQGGIDYYWRVRAKDPSGSDSYGAWTTARKMTTEAIAPTVTSGSASSITTSSASIAGNVTSTGGATVTERGIVYALTANPTTSNSKQTAGTGAGAFTANLSGLSSNTTYNYRAYAINAKGTSYGANQTFSTLPIPPAVNTGAVSGITLTGATVATSLGANPDSQTITERGVVYGTSTNPTTANSKKTGTDSITLTGLTQDTTYYARAYIIWSGGTVYGSQVSFKTQGRVTTTLNTPSASASVSELRPNLEFTGTDPDNDQITYQLQLHTSNVWTSPLLDVLSADGGFSNRSDVKTDPFYSGNQIRYTPQSDLSRGQQYYWRVRGKDSGSGEWGNWTVARAFTVSAVPATVTISGFSDILDTSLKINGSITSDGGATVTERGAVLSASPNPTTASLKFTATGSPFTATATGLTSSTTYYVRTYAINSAGTSYSAESTVMTLQPLAPPTVTVGDPTRLIDVSAQLAAEVTLDGRREVTERGIVFSTSPNPDTDDNKVTANTAGLGSYTLLLTGLLPETTYYYRAYAINDQGTGYSTEKSFTTLAPFVPDEGDGYWVFSVSESNAVVSRSQATPANSSVNLPLADLGLEDGKTYTLAIGDIEHTLGSPKVSLLYYDAANPVVTDVSENSQLTFTYNLTDYHTYILQLHVTQGTAVTEEFTTTFKDLYLAEESTFSSFVPFTPYGQFEIKLENNQIVDKRREAVIGSMFTRLEGWETAPFEVKTEGLGYFEIGDGITIKDPEDNEVKTHLTEYRLQIDGGISETLKGTRPPDAETDYSKAGNIKKLISNTTLQVDKQNQTIEALVSDVYDNDGYIEEKFSQVSQDINQVRTTVQGAGGVNLIRNSVMYAYNNLGYPENWTTTHVGGEGSTIVIQGSAESKAAGGLSGNSFMLNGTKVVQTVTVRKDADFISDENKTYYTFNIKVKKNLVGTAYIKLSNRQEEHTINLPSGEEYLWENFTLEGLLPKDDHYDIEIYSDSDAVAQFTDAMLSVGEYAHSWTQAPGEVGNASVSITENGLTIRQDQFRYNYTHMDALGLNVHKRIRGQSEEVFGFNADETNMSKVKANKQISMGKVRVVPIEVSGMSGWAWTGTEE